MYRPRQHRQLAMVQAAQRSTASVVAAEVGLSIAAATQNCYTAACWMVDRIVENPLFLCNRSVGGSIPPLGTIFQLPDLPMMTLRLIIRGVRDAAHSSLAPSCR